MLNKWPEWQKEEEDFSTPPPLYYQLLQHPRQQHHSTAATITIVLQKQVSALHSLVWFPSLGKLRVWSTVLNQIM
ncbi:hypothetical protein M5D96_001678, partial [Drosophila gunungcola]